MSLLDTTRHYFIHNVTREPSFEVPHYGKKQMHPVGDDYDELVAEEDEETARMLHGTQFEEEAEILQKHAEWLWPDVAKPRQK